MTSFMRRLDMRTISDWQKTWNGPAEDNPFRVWEVGGLEGYVEVAHQQSVSSLPKPKLVDEADALAVMADAQH